MQWLRSLSSPCATARSPCRWPCWTGRVQHGRAAPQQEPCAPAAAGVGPGRRQAAARLWRAARRGRLPGVPPARAPAGGRGGRWHGRPAGPGASRARGHAGARPGRRAAAALHRPSGSAPALSWAPAWARPESCGERRYARRRAGSARGAGATAIAFAEGGDALLTAGAGALRAWRWEPGRRASSAPAAWPAPAALAAGGGRLLAAAVQGPLLSLWRADAHVVRPPTPAGVRVRPAPAPSADSLGEQALGLGAAGAPAAQAPVTPRVHVRLRSCAAPKAAERAGAPGAPDGCCAPARARRLQARPAGHACAACFYAARTAAERRACAQATERRAPTRPPPWRAARRRLVRRAAAEACERWTEQGPARVMSVGRACRHSVSGEQRGPRDSQHARQQRRTADAP